jgi:cytochrome c peroxidase
MRDFFRRHFPRDLLDADRSIRVTPDHTQTVPHVGTGQILRDTPTDFIVPANTRLRARMPLHRGAQVPFKRPHIILGHAKTHGVHDPDQLLRVGIAGPRGGQKRLSCFDEFSRLHQIARLFNLCHGRGGEQHERKSQVFHMTSSFQPKWRAALAAASLACTPALAEPISEADFHAFDPDKAAIGQLLFYDPILSGNQNIACGTCHNHDHAGTDGLALGIGEGGVGIGPKRTAGTGDSEIVKRVPRNAPALFNLGHTSVSTMFHDGRVSVSDLFGNGFNTPAEEWLPRGLDGLLSAQALFPMTSQTEMAGQPRENEVAGASNDRVDYVWPIIAKRVRTIPEYGQMFVDAFEDVASSEDVTIVHIANALGAFMSSEWRSYDSAYDAFLAGTPLPADAESGRVLFFGAAGCAECHNGPLLTDEQFHALAVPHFGPGRTRGFDPYAREVGRMGESNRLEDAYRFRTPALRNVALTGPWGHNGAFPTLEAVVRHHLDPHGSFDAWTPEMVKLPEAPKVAAIDFVALQDSRERARLRSKIDITPRQMTDADVADLVAFLHALTGEDSVDGRLGKPDSVPSGRPVE